jgi:hypothetical protein
MVLATAASDLLTPACCLCFSCVPAAVLKLSMLRLTPAQLTAGAQICLRLQGTCDTPEELCTNGGSAGCT